MSSVQSITQYNIAVSGSQPNSGSDYGVQFTLEQTGTFGDTDAVALFNAQVAAFPSSFGTPISSLSKVTTDMTQTNWSTSAQAWQ